jgi:hypothetical protein
MVVCQAVVCQAVSAGDLQAQLPAPPPPGESALLDSARAVRGAKLSVSLLTYGPGEEVFEKFGHMALAIVDSTTGQDIAFNWGMFDFNQPNFLTRFLTGDTKYWMAGFNTDAFNGLYRRDNRTVRRQQLVLSPIERAALFEFIAWQAREENKFYRYDYYRDNCATRVRDALDRVLRGQLQPALKVPGGGRTWRGETARITASDLATYAGIEIALGRHADEALSKWDEAFLPEHLANHLSHYVARAPDGHQYKLVSTDSLIAPSSRVPLSAEPPERLTMAALLGLTLAGLIAMLADRRARISRAALSIGVGIWFVVGGCLGTALLLAATVTKHAPYMGTNTTLLQLHPLLLVAAFPVARALGRGFRGSVALGASAVMAALAVCGALLQLVPSLAQGSGVVLAVTVPVHIALAIAVWRLDTGIAPRRRSNPALARAA